MTFDTIAISDIKPYEKNAKTHPKKQVELLAENITRFGFTTPCLVDKDNNLIAGHGRLEAVKTLGWTDVPCVRMENLTEDEVKALRLADNKLAEMSEWDMALVTDELKELDDELLDLTGFDKDLIIEPDEADDEVPDVPEEPQSKLGDLYELGNHRVLCGDSTKIEDVERLMDGKKADMVFTDPPYGVDYEGINNDSREGLEELLTDAFGVLVGFSKKGASAYMFHSDRCADIFHKVFRLYFHFSSMIIWEKPSLVLSQTDYQSKHEPILYGWVDNGTHQFFGDRKQVSVWKCDKEPRTQGHTTPKPVEACSRGILNSSKTDDIIADTFLGSGSTLIASEKTGRICYGMELDPKYCDVIVQRYVDYTKNATIKKNGEEIVWKTAKKQLES